MSRWSRLACISWVVTCAAFGGTVEGIAVEDHTGNPLASVELRFHKDGVRELIADLETGRDGRFRAEEIPAGDYRVEVLKANHITTTLRVKVTAGAPATLPVRLVRYGVIAGQATDPDGKPLPGVLRVPTGRSIGGAFVFVWNKPAGGGLPKLHGRPVTLGSDGRFRVNDLAPGQYLVALSYYGLPDEAGAGLMYYPDNARPQVFTVTGGELYDNIRFSVLPGSRFRIKGTIQGPKPGMRFGLSLLPAGNPEVALTVQQSEDDGSFQFDGVPQGAYEILVAGPARGYGGGLMGAVLGDGQVFGRARVDVAGQNIDGLTISAGNGRPASFLLSTADAACPSSATLRLARVENWGATTTRATAVNTAKAATVQDLPPGRYQLTLTGLGDTCFPSSPSMLDLTGGDPGVVTMKVAAAGSIRGHLVGGTGSYAVVLAPSDAGDESPAVRVEYPDSEGRFLFAGLRPGRYRIAAQPSGAANVQTAETRWVANLEAMFEIEVPGGTPTDVELPAPAAKP